MGDEFLSFSAAPIPAAQPKQKSQKQKPTKLKTSRKMVSDSETVYGEELFQAAWKPEKSIVVCFWPFTKNMIRISKDQYKGKFAIQYDKDGSGDLLLYHFTPPLNWDYPEVQDQNGKMILDTEVDLEIHIDESVRVYGPYESVDKIKLKIMGIIRAETLLSKKQSLQELQEKEAAEKFEKERLEDESEQITDELAAAGILHDSNKSNISASENVIASSQISEKIQSETREEKKDESSKIVKDRSGATIKFTPIVY